jgi:DNA polymerase-1
MLIFNERLAGDGISFRYLETSIDAFEYMEFVNEHRWLALDTESTGLNCYAPGWQLRMFQCGDAHTSYVVPARMSKLIAWTMRLDRVKWIGHNGPHDIRCIDEHLGYETGVECVGETFIPSHHLDPRNQQEGGVGHGLKELAIHYVDRDAGRWEVALKKQFKSIEILVPGEVYKSGPRKGTQKVRKAKLSEGWGLINPKHPAYIAYAAADPILTYRVWQYLQPTVRLFTELYRFDRRVQMACDRLQRRGMPTDIPYSSRLSAAYTRKAETLMAVAAEYGCANIHSGQQVAKTLAALGVRLSERTPTGQYKTDDRVLRGIALLASDEPDISRFINAVLVAKQVLKRRENYTDAFLAEINDDSRVHASINSLAARTARMSVSRPALQQLPTKDREDEVHE